MKFFNFWWANRPSKIRRKQLYKWWWNWKHTLSKLDYQGRRFRHHRCQRGQCMLCLLTLGSLIKWYQKHKLHSMVELLVYTLQESETGRDIRNEIWKKVEPLSKMYKNKYGEHRCINVRFLFKVSNVNRICGPGLWSNQHLMNNPLLYSPTSPLRNIESISSATSDSKSTLTNPWNRNQMKPS